MYVLGQKVDFSLVFRVCYIIRSKTEHTLEGQREQRKLDKGCEGRVHIVLLARRRAFSSVYLNNGAKLIDLAFLQTVELKVRMCCSGCERIVKNAIYKLRGN